MTCVRKANRRGGTEKKNEGEMEPSLLSLKGGKPDRVIKGKSIKAAVMKVVIMKVVVVLLIIALYIAVNVLNY